MRRFILALVVLGAFIAPLFSASTSAGAIYCSPAPTGGSAELAPPKNYPDETTCPAGEVEFVVESCDDTSKSILGIPTWYKYLKGERISGKCRPIVASSSDALPIGLAVFEAAITLGGLVAVVFIFVASFQYVLTQGEPDKAANARKTVINAVVGLVILIVATRVVSFIAKELTS